MNLHLRCVALGAGLSLLGSCVSTQGQGAAPTPQRPTLSHNTNTTAVGTYELEAGVEIDPSDFVDTPMLVKYGLTPRTEFVFGGSLLRHNDDTDETGIGDFVFGARHRIVDETVDQPALAALVLVKLPLADRDDGLGSGETDVIGSIAAQKQLDAVNVVGFYALGLLGDVNSDGLDISHTLAAAGSISVAQNLDAFGELGAVFVPENDYDAWLATLGAQFLIGPSTIFDAGFRVGLSDDAPDFSLIFGVTHNFGAGTLPTPRVGR